MNENEQRQRLAWNQNLKKRRKRKGFQLTWKESFNGGENRGAHSNLAELLLREKEGEGKALILQRELK